MRRGARWLGRIGDPPLLALALVLAGVGIAMIYSAGQVEVASVATGIWVRQLMWLFLAVAAFWAAVHVPLRWLEWAAPWIYAASLFLLLLVLFFGTGPAEHWLRIGALRVQPVEVAKLGTILMLARVLAGREEPVTRLAELWQPVAIVLAPLALVLLQPDLGGAIILGVILIAALYWTGIPLAKILLLVSPGVSLILGFDALVWGIWFVLLAGFLYLHRPFVSESIAVVLGNVAAGALTLPLWRTLAAYQQNRILVFLEPGIDPRGAGWHLIQSKVAIGSGGWFGQGFAQGPQKRLAFLPEQHTDFIFSVAGEELGFAGVVVLLVLLGGFLWRVLRVAVRAGDEFGSAVAFCLFAVWFAHVTVNVGMTVGLMPITGLPLPFLSYGGSFLFILFLGLALVQRVAAER